MWLLMSHKSSTIFTVVMAERDESPLPTPTYLSPSHSHVYLPVIHALELRLLMPCLLYIWHIMCHNVSSNELTQRRRRKKKQLPSPSLFFCVHLHWYSGCVWTSRFTWFTGEVLSDLYRTVHCVTWYVCVSPHVSHTTDNFEFDSQWVAVNSTDIHFILL